MVDNLSCQHFRKIVQKLCDVKSDYYDSYSMNSK